MFVWLRARVLEEVILEPFVLQFEVLGLCLSLDHTFKVERDLMLDYAGSVFLRQIERVAISLINVLYWFLFTNLFPLQLCFGRRHHSEELELVWLGDAQLPDLVDDVLLEVRVEQALNMVTA